MAGRQKIETSFEGPVGYGAPRAGAKKLFAGRLWRLMLRKQWNQSDLSRASGIGKDVISGYVRGKHLPDPPNANRLADALGVTAEELFPELVGEEGPPASNTPFDIRAIPGTGRVLMRINTVVEMPQADAFALAATLTQATNPEGG